MRPSLRLFTLLSVCVGCSTSPGPAAGSERGPCYGNGTCDGALMCLSAVCVAIPSEDTGLRDGGGGAADMGTDAPGDAGAPERRTYVVSHIALPVHASDSAQYGLDLDGDGVHDNAFGSLLGALNTASGSTDLSLQPSSDAGVRSAAAIMLLEALASSFAAGSIMARVLEGQHPSPAACTTPGDLSTCGMHLVGTGHFDLLPPTRPLLSGNIATSTFDVGPDESAFPFFPNNASPVWVPLVGARIHATVTSEGLMSGVLGGGIRQSDMNTILFPAWQSGIAAAITRDCPSVGGCASGSEGAAYVTLFDADHDGAVTVVELATSSFISALVAPDVDLLDASGNPGRDGTADTLSVGIGFTAVGATF